MGLFRKRPKNPVPRDLYENPAALEEAVEAVEAELEQLDHALNQNPGLLERRRLRKQTAASETYLDALYAAKRVVEQRQEFEEATRDLANSRRVQEARGSPLREVPEIQLPEDAERDPRIRTANRELLDEKAMARIGAGVSADEDPFPTEIADAQAALRDLAPEYTNAPDQPFDGAGVGEQLEMRADPARVMERLAQADLQDPKSLERALNGQAPVPLSPLPLRTTNLGNSIADRSARARENGEFPFTVLPSFYGIYNAAGEPAWLPGEEPSVATNPELPGPAASHGGDEPAPPPLDPALQPATERSHAVRESIFLKLTGQERLEYGIDISTRDGLAEARATLVRTLGAIAAKKEDAEIEAKYGVILTSADQEEAGPQRRGRLLPLSEEEAREYEVDLSERPEHAPTGLPTARARFNLIGDQMPSTARLLWSEFKYQASMLPEHGAELAKEGIDALAEAGREARQEFSRALREQRYIAFTPVPEARLERVKEATFFKGIRNMLYRRGEETGVESSVPDETLLDKDLVGYRVEPPAAALAEARAALVRTLGAVAAQAASKAAQQKSPFLPEGPLNEYGISTESTQEATPAERERLEEVLQPQDKLTAAAEPAEATPESARPEPAYDARAAIATPRGFEVSRAEPEKRAEPMTDEELRELEWTMGLQIRSASEEQRYQSLREKFVELHDAEPAIEVPEGVGAIRQAWRRANPRNMKESWVIPGEAVYRATGEVVPFTREASNFLGLEENLGLAAVGNTGSASEPAPAPMHDFLDLKGNLDRAATGTGGKSGARAEYDRIRAAESELQARLEERPYITTPEAKSERVGPLPDEQQESPYQAALRLYAHEREQSIPQVLEETGLKKSQLERLIKENGVTGRRESSQAQREARIGYVTSLLAENPELTTKALREDDTYRAFGKRQAEPDKVAAYQPLSDTTIRRDLTLARQAR